MATFIEGIEKNPFMADRDFEILDDLPNLDDLILEEEIELVSSRLYNVSRPKSERETSGESSSFM